MWEITAGFEKVAGASLGVPGYSSTASVGSLFGNAVAAAVVEIVQVLRRVVGHLGFVEDGGV